ncbi:MAG TPA: spore protease YyaC [Pseudogracilibacillus sp.]|nr:spore protease YyaC [Pseudogracilibacillus sp.]
MNINNSISAEKKTIRMLHTEPSIIKRLSSEIVSWFPQQPREYVVVCIGTDRSTGDSLGPLTGTLLSDQQPRHLTVYGTLHEPVHATNLQEYANKINNSHENPYVIAIDACLGKSTSVGQLITGTGSLQPGAALQKSLPAMGDMFITGVVNISGFMEYSVLQNTRLSLVVDLARVLSEILLSIDEQLTYNERLPSIVVTSQHQRLG